MHLCVCSPHYNLHYHTMDSISGNNALQQEPQYSMCVILLW